MDAKVPAEIGQHLICAAFPLKFSAGDFGSSGERF